MHGCLDRIAILLSKGTSRRGFSRSSECYLCLKPKSPSTFSEPGDGISFYTFTHVKDIVGVGDYQSAYLYIPINYDVGVRSFASKAQKGPIY